MALHAIRTEKVHVARQPVPAANTVEARVVEEVFKGAMDHLSLATTAGARLDANVANESALGEIFHEGDKVFCGLHADDLVVLRAE